MATRLAMELGAFKVNVALESRRKVTRAPSFKGLGPDKKPPVSKKYSATTGKELGETERMKGVEVGKDKYETLDESVIEKIKGQKDVVIKPVQIVPVQSIDLSLAFRSYAVVPDEKVPGAFDSVDLVWNGLIASKKAYVAQVTMKGSMDSILVVHATDAKDVRGQGLWAEQLPFVNELYSVDEPEFAKDAKKAKTFEAFVELEYEDELGEAFDHAQYASKFLERRQELIEKALAGKPIELPEEPEAETSTNLMDALEATVKSAAKRKPAKKPAKKKVSA